MLSHDQDAYEAVVRVNDGEKIVVEFSNKSGLPVNIEVDAVESHESDEQPTLSAHLSWTSSLFQATESPYSLVPQHLNQYVKVIVHHRNHTVIVTRIAVEKR